MTEAAKCAHPSCECVVAARSPYGKYCSEHCKKTGQITELRCNCQHAECRQPQPSVHRASGMPA